MNSAVYASMETRVVHYVVRGAYIAQTRSSESCTQYQLVHALVKDISSDEMGGRGEKV